VRRQLAVLVAALASGVLLAADSRAPEHPPDPTPGPIPASAPATTTSRAQHPISVLLAEYDAIYAQVAGHREIFQNPDHPFQRRMRELLTPDSSLRRPVIISAFDENDPRHHVIRAGTRLLHRGERNARLPIIHEPLGHLPNPDRASGTVQVAICSHMHYTIFDRQMRGVEAALDVRQPGLATFRAVDGEWRLHDYGWIEDRTCERCGPEPPGTGHLATAMENGAERSRRPDPPCPRSHSRRR
jgi:hypothetical protein